MMPKSAARASNWRGWYVTVMLSLLSAITATAVSQFSATLSQVAEQLGTDEATVAFVDAVKYFFSVSAVLIAPYLIRKYGKRAVFAAACFVFLIPQMCVPFTRDYSLFVVLKVMQGLCVMLFPLALVMIADRCAPRDIGLATALLNGFTYAGGAVGGTVAGFCLSRMGWRSSYHVISAAMLAMSLFFMLTFPKDEQTGKESSGAAADSGKDYRSVVGNKLTWLLVLAFFPTVWTVQAIWSDMIPFGRSLGFSGAQMGGVMGVSALSILTASLLSGKISDLAASRGRDRKKLRRRVAVFSLGTALIIAGVAVLLSVDLSPPNTGLFNFIVFSLSFGAAWGLGSFYSIFPEHFKDGEVAVANGFIGGLADMGMPVSPMFMAVVGIGMNRWYLAWSSCAFIAATGLFVSLVILSKAKGASEEC
jgi:MFS family permease